MSFEEICQGYADYHHLKLDVCFDCSPKIKYVITDANSHVVFKGIGFTGSRAYEALIDDIIKATGNPIREIVRIAEIGIAFQKSDWKIEPYVRLLERIATAEDYKLTINPTVASSLFRAKPNLDFEASFLNCNVVDGECKYMPMNHNIALPLKDALDFWKARWNVSSDPELEVAFAVRGV